MLSHTVNSVSHFEELPDFSKGLHWFTFPPAVFEDSGSPHSPQHLWLSAFFIIKALVDVKRSFDFYFPNDMNIFYVLIVHLYVFNPFLNWIIFLLL